MATDDKDKKEEMMPNSNFGSMSLYDSDIWKRAKERIDAMPEGKEKERAKFLLAQDYAGLKDILGADVASSEAMLNEQMPEGRQAGSVYVAANPLEFLSSALRQGIGAKGRRNSMDALRQLSADQAEARGNIQFPGDGGGQEQPQGNHNMPVAQFAAAQAEANKPTLDSLTSQRPGLNQGLSDITQQAMQPSPQQLPQQLMSPEAQVGRGMERRGELRQKGITPPAIGDGLGGQVKQAAALRGDTGRGASGGWEGGRGASASWGTPDQPPAPQRPYFSGKKPAPFNPRGAAISQGMTERMNPNWDPEEQKKKDLFALLDLNTRR